MGILHLAQTDDRSLIPFAHEAHHTRYLLRLVIETRRMPTVRTIGQKSRVILECIMRRIKEILYIIGGNTIAIAGYCTAGNDTPDKYKKRPIHREKTYCYDNIATAVLSARMSASISSRVLYNASEARMVPGTPKASMSGSAQW